MQIIIPTYRRTNKQLTFSQIPKKWRERTTFVVDKKDAKELKGEVGRAKILVHPSDITSIAKKRAWILQTFDVDTLVMFDDDLRFAFRPEPAIAKLKKAGEDEVNYYLKKLDKRLEIFAHAGFSPRQGNISLGPGWNKNKRMIYSLGYQVPTVRKHCKLGRIEHREDMELALQLLTKGFPNVVCADFACDQNYGSSGGASESGRSMKASNADAEKLARMFPGLVKVVDREYKGSQNRKEVVVSWLGAFARSQELI